MRVLAVLVAKNTFWHGGHLSEEEKLYLRQKLFSMLDESSHLVATQVAIFIGKIARNDFPAHWPGLLSSLLVAIRDGGERLRLRALLALHHVIVALRSKGSLGRSQFQDVRSLIYS